MFDTAEKKAFLDANAAAMFRIVVAVHSLPPSEAGLNSEGLAEVSRIIGEAQAAGIDTIAVSETRTPFER